MQILNGICKRYFSYAVWQPLRLYRRKLSPNQRNKTKREKRIESIHSFPYLHHMNEEVCPWTKKNLRRSPLHANVRREVRSLCAWSWNAIISAMCRWIRFFSGLWKKKFVKLPNRISPLANWTFYCGKGLASSRSIRYNVIDEVSFPLWRYTWKRTKK